MAATNATSTLHTATTTITGLTTGGLIPFGNGYIQGVKWDKLGNDIMTSGLAIGALVGFIRTR